MQNTLVMAQTTADEVKSVAKQQADQIINDAQREAEDIKKAEKEQKKKEKKLKTVKIASPYTVEKQQKQVPKFLIIIGISLLIIIIIYVVILIQIV